MRAFLGKSNGVKHCENNYLAAKNAFIQSQGLVSSSEASVLDFLNSMGNANVKIDRSEKNGAERIVEVVKIVALTLGVG